MSKKPSPASFSLGGALNSFTPHVGRPPQRGSSERGREQGRGDGGEADMVRGV